LSALLETLIVGRELDVGEESSILMETFQTIEKIPVMIIEISFSVFDMEKTNSASTSKRKYNLMKTP